VRHRPVERVSSFALLLVACSFLGVFAGCRSVSSPVAMPPVPPATPPLAVSTTAPAFSWALPPPPLAAKPSPFPTVAKSALPNGLRVSIATSHALPLIELRVVVHAGAGFGPPGVAEITAEMLKEGGTREHTASEMVWRIDTLGASLRVAVGPDATRLSLGVVTGQLDQALDILGELVRSPRFDATELSKVKARMTDEAEEDARANGTWVATRALFHGLFPAASPYSTYGVVPAEIAKVDGTAIRRFYERLYVPSNVEVIVTGDVDPVGVSKAIERAFGTWKTSGPVASGPPLDFPEPSEPEMTRVIVANRPKSVQSDIVVTELLPERHSPGWPVDRVALQVFGGGLTGRLFRDVREKRSLAYSTSAHPIELAHDEQPLFAYAGARTPKTAEAVEAVLETLVGMRTSPPTDREVVTARRYLSDIFAVHMETLGAIADMIAELRELDLPDDYWDTYRTALRAVTTAETDAEASQVFTANHALVIVVGDESVVADSLTRFGEVTVVDPEHDFRVLRTLPKGSR